MFHMLKHFHHKTFQFCNKFTQVSTRSNNKTELKEFEHQSLQRLWLTNKNSCTCLEADVANIFPTCLLALLNFIKDNFRCPTPTLRAGPMKLFINKNRSVLCQRLAKTQPWDEAVQSVWPPLFSSTTTKAIHLKGSMQQALLWEGKFVGFNNKVDMAGRSKQQEGQQSSGWTLGDV